MDRNGTELNGTNRNPNCFTLEENGTKRNGKEQKGTKLNESKSKLFHFVTERIEIGIVSIRNEMKRNKMKKIELWNGKVRSVIFLKNGKK